MSSRAASQVGGIVVGSTSSQAGDPRKGYIIGNPQDNGQPAPDVAGTIERAGNYLNLMNRQAPRRNNNNDDDDDDDEDSIKDDDIQRSTPAGTPDPPRSQNTPVQMTPGKVDDSGLNPMGEFVISEKNIQYLAILATGMKITYTPADNLKENPYFNLFMNFCMMHRRKGQVSKNDSYVKIGGCVLACATNKDYGSSFANIGIPLFFKNHIVRAAATLGYPLAPDDEKIGTDVDRYWWKSINKISGRLYAVEKTNGNPIFHELDAPSIFAEKGKSMLCNAVLRMKFRRIHKKSDNVQIVGKVNLSSRGKWGVVFDLVWLYYTQLIDVDGPIKDNGPKVDHVITDTDYATREHLEDIGL